MTNMATQEERFKRIILMAEEVGLAGGKVRRRRTITDAIIWFVGISAFVTSTTCLFIIYGAV